MDRDRECRCACCDFERRFKAAVLNDEDVEIIVDSSFHPEDAQLSPGLFAYNMDERSTLLLGDYIWLQHYN